MNEPDNHPERNRNIWAPWRLEYINSLDGIEDNGCFLCRNREHPEQDQSNLVLWRGRHCFTMLNRFPYTGGHAMIAPYEHVGDLDSLSPSAMLEMMEMTRDLRKVLEDTVHAQGFNVGINLGRCAGAGLPGHLHMHIVPRWNGDTNFTGVLGNIRVIPQALSDLLVMLQKSSQKLNLPDLSS